MKTLICLGSGLLATMLFIPGLAMAQPRHDVPRDCIGRGGEVMCHVRGCERFCNHHGPGHHKGPAPAPHHHAAPVPPPAPHHHAAPVPPPAPHHHVAPVPPPPPPPVVIVPPPAPMHHRARIDADIHRLMADNDRLQHDLARERRHADEQYNSCIVNLPPMIRNRCTYPDHEIHRIERQIHENNREIERLRRMR